MAQNTFSGQYVEDMLDVLTASAVSGGHGIIIGPPGWGKTDVSWQAALAMAGYDGFSFTRLDPSTEPSKILGAYNPAKMLAGDMERVTDGPTPQKRTPYAPGVTINIFDEVFRAEDAVYDILIDTLNRIELAPNKRPAVWATANFVASGARVEALIDRITFWLWLSPDMLDTDQIVAGQLGSLGSPQIDRQLPTPDEVQKIRASKPGPAAIKAIQRAVDGMRQAADKGQRSVHPRLITKWTWALYYYSVYLTGDENFTAVPDKAMKILQYAYPNTTAAEADAWREIALTAADPVQAVLDAELGKAMAAFKEVAKIADPIDRSNQSGRLGKIAAEAQANLKRLESDDPRIDAAIKRITYWYSQAVSGQTVD